MSGVAAFARLPVASPQVRLASTRQAQGSRMGAGVLLAPSKDWTAISYAHVRSARLRAIENGASLFRLGASGISLAVDPYGPTAPPRR